VNECPSVMLVDDDVDCLAIARMALEAGGYRVVCCHGRDEALAQLTEELPDVVVTDLMMGRLDAGFSLARTIKADQRLRRIPILLVTGIGSELGYDIRPRTTADLAAMGADAFLLKPLSPASLREAVDRLVGHSTPG
jgi:CheY-like chemotaxis protein